MPKPKKRRAKEPYGLLVQLDPHDKALLHEAAAAEKLTLSDTVRRAIRAHARRVRRSIEPAPTAA